MKVNLNEVFNSTEYKENNYKLPIALGRTSQGSYVIKDLASMPHLLVAGSTGSGKSVCLDTIILSLSRLSNVSLLLVDTKVVGFSIYNGMPNLLCPVLTEEREITEKLNILVKEMNDRYSLIAENRVRSLEEYNRISNEKLNRIVLIIDEYADLMMTNKEAQKLITGLAQKSRACGIHIVLSTQRPSAEVVPGVLKANILARIALSVSSSIDSRVILGQAGAEKLNGNGDMLFQFGRELIHLQGAYVSDNEIRSYTRVRSTTSTKVEINEVKKEDKDELYNDVVKLALQKGFISIGYIQRGYKVSYDRARRIMKQLEDNNVVTRQNGVESRKVLVG